MRYLGFHAQSMSGKVKKRFAYKLYIIGGFDMINRKRRILIMTGILVVVLALGVGLFVTLNQRWMDFDEFGGLTTLRTEDSTVHWQNGTLVIVYHIDEPAAYVWNQRTALDDGVRIRNGRPYLSARDLQIVQEMVWAMAAADITDPVAVITLGLYGQGTEEQNAMIHAFLGGEQARERFELYFQWYNTIHELGHAITVHNGTYGPPDMGFRHMVDEEILVNSFAVAFWMYYGEEEKLNALSDMVDYALSNIPPAVDYLNHIDFMREAVDGLRYAPFTFEVYGWFQFSLVRDILRERDSLDLAALLTQMTGIESVRVPPERTLVYPSLGTDIVPIILADAISILNNRGISLPSVYVTFSTDPNNHMLQYISRAFLEQSIAEGLVIPVLP